jgi:hypothetical protein
MSEPLPLTLTGAESAIIAAAVLTVNPGDALVLTIRARLSKEAARRISEELPRQFPSLKERGIPVLVLEEGATLASEYRDELIERLRNSP